MVRGGSWLLLVMAFTALLSQLVLVFGIRAGSEQESEEARLGHGQDFHKPSKKHKKHHHHGKHHQKHEAEPKAEELKLPAVLLIDVQNQDRALGDATHLLPSIDSLTSPWARIGGALRDFDPDISDVSEIAPSGTDLKQRLRLRNVVACSNTGTDTFVTFNGWFVGRKGFTTVRLDHRGDGQIYASVMGEFSDPVSNEGREEESISGGGDVVQLIDLTGSEEEQGYFAWGPTELTSQQVFERLTEICMLSAKPPKLEVELQWATSRGELLMALPDKVENITNTILFKGLAGASPVLKVHGAAKEMLSSLLDARYAWHPAFAGKLGADLEAVRRKLGEAMGRLDSAVQGTKELVDEIKGQMDDAVRTSQAALGDSTKLGLRLRQEVPEEWQPTYISSLVDNARRQLEDIWAKVAFTYAALASAYARTVRLLTLGARAAVEVEDPLRPNITSLGDDAREEDYDFLRAFVMADLGAHADVDELWERVNLIGPMIQEAMWMASHTPPKYNDRSVEQNLRGMQEGLRSLNAFGYPALLHVAETTADPQKAEWARQWSHLRSSLDFTVWPAGSEATKMVMPRICQSTYEHMGTDNLARFPDWMGGHAIMHEFMIYAGGELPDRTHCRDLLNGLVKGFPQTAEDRTRQYSMWPREYEEVAELGCLGYEQWSKTGGEIYHDMQESLRKLSNITLRIKLPVIGGSLVAPAMANGEETYEVKEVTVNAEKPQESHKHRRGPRTRHLSRGLAGAIVRYMTHTVTKYSSKSGGDFMQGAKASLQRNPPFFSAEQLSNQFWRQLAEEGVPSPFEPHRCGKADGEYECDDWNSSVPGFWYEARIAGDTLEAALDTLEATFAKRQPGDWAPIAQSPATYAAVGFDSAGVIDNGDWECENTTQICEVHPKCGRIAAQMLQYPFAGDKKYASAWSDKAITYAQAAESGILSKLNYFYFDSDGYHGYCHSPGKAYCWSYTACLREMLKWLCSQSETSEQCCPNQEVRDACQDDVNGEGCKVCWDTIQPDQVFDESVDYFYEGTISNETMEFIHPDATDLAARQEMAEKQTAAETCDVCKFLKEKDENSREWAFVSTEGDCAKHREICAEVCGHDQPVDKIGDWDNCKQDALEKACEGCK